MLRFRLHLENADCPSRNSEPSYPTAEWFQFQVLELQGAVTGIVHAMKNAHESAKDCSDDELFLQGVSEVSERVGFGEMLSALTIFQLPS